MEAPANGAYALKLWQENQHLKRQVDMLRVELAEEIERRRALQLRLCNQAKES